MPSALNDFLCERKADLPRRLIVHAGTTKTGTTSLQFYLDRHREQFKSHGVLYPSTGTTIPPEPKHQWIVDDLLHGGDDDLIARFRSILDEADSRTHTIILSTEGVSNHWWDFSTSGIDNLKILARHLDSKCWLWLREPIAYFGSYYEQMMRNPQMPSVPAYGQDMTVDDAVRIPWAIRHVDYKGLLASLREVFGDRNVYPFAYSRDIVGVVSSLLNVPVFGAEDAKDNISLRREVGMELLRIVNRFELTSDEKVQAVRLVSQLTTLVGPRSPTFQLSETARIAVQAVAGLSADELETMGRDSVARWRRACDASDETATSV